LPSTPRGPAYRIRTARLLLRCWDPSDAPLLKEAIDESIEHLMAWMPWAHNEPEEVGKKVERLRRYRAMFDRSEDFYYGIFDPPQTAVWGAIGLHTRLGEGTLEIGYWIRTSQLRQGLATEAAAALVRVAFEIHGVQRVEIHCDPRNVASAAIPRRLGFVHEATLPRRRVFGDELRDEMVWAFHAPQYSGSAEHGISLEAYDAMGRRIL
jgi:RimJ/RimL family protein N-acetyltransferase